MTILFLIAALAAQPSRTFTGVITDSMCVLNHGMMKIQPESKCVVYCIKSSKDAKYALHDGKKLYVLSDQQTPEKFAAQKVRVRGVLYEKTGIIKVESIEAAK
jgi:hypothetical protein